MKKKTKRLLAQLGQKKLRKALRRAVMMRCALRAICNWSIHDADDGAPAVNCGSLSRFGSYVPPTAAQRAAVIAERIESQNSAAIWERQAQQVALAF